MSRTRKTVPLKAAYRKARESGTLIRRDEAVPSMERKTHHSLVIPSSDQDSIVAVEEFLEKVSGDTLTFQGKLGLLPKVRNYEISFSEREEYGSAKKDRWIQQFLLEEQFIGIFEKIDYRKDFFRFFDFRKGEPEDEVYSDSVEDFFRKFPEVSDLFTIFEITSVLRSESSVREIEELRFEDEVKYGLLRKCDCLYCDRSNFKNRKAPTVEDFEDDLQADPVEVPSFDGSGSEPTESGSTVVWSSDPENLDSDLD